MLQTSHSFINIKSYCQRNKAMLYKIQNWEELGKQRPNFHGYVSKIAFLRGFPLHYICTQLYL